MSLGHRREMKAAGIRSSDNLVVRISGTLLALALGLLGALVGLELVVRYVMDDGMNFDLEMWKYARQVKQTSPDEAIGHVHAPGRSGMLMGVPVATNSMGLRDREYALEKPAGSVRILMLGDSVTFGWGVRAEDTPSELLEQRLNALSPSRKFEVLNAGVGNSNSAMEVAAFFRQWQRFDPDVIILNFFINDAEPTPRRRDSTVLEYSAAAVYVAGAADRLARSHFGKSDWKAYYAGLYGDGNPAWPTNQDAIRRLADHCRSQGIALVLANYPELHQLDPYPFPQVTAAIAETARVNGIPFIDLLPAVKDEQPSGLWVSQADPHPNARANQAYAAAIESGLKLHLPGFFRF